MAEEFDAALSGVLEIIGSWARANIALCEFLVESGVLDRSALLKFLATKREEAGEDYSTSAFDALISGLERKPPAGLQ